MLVECGGRALFCLIKPSRAEPSRAEPSRAEPSRAEPSRAEPSHFCVRTPAAADAVGRAARPRERHARTPEGPAHALNPRPRRAAGPASSFFSFLSGLVGRLAPASSSRPAVGPRPFRPALAAVLAAAFSLLLAAGAAEAQTNNNVLIYKDDSAIPSGLKEGDRFRLLVITRNNYFISTQLYDSNNSPNIAHHNTAVQDGVAADAGLRPYSNKFRALVSTSAVHARDNTGTTGTGVPIYWYKGDKVADDYADFYDGSWDSYDTRSHAGSPLSGKFARAITGSNNNGTRSNRPLGSEDFVTYGCPEFAQPKP